MYFHPEGITNDLGVQIILLRMGGKFLHEVDHEHECLPVHTRHLGQYLQQENTTDETDWTQTKNNSTVGSQLSEHIGTEGCSDK